MIKLLQVGVYRKQGVLLPYQIRIHGSSTTFEMGLYVSFFPLNIYAIVYCLIRESWTRVNEAIIYHLKYLNFMYKMIQK